MQPETANDNVFENQLKREAIVFRGIALLEAIDGYPSFGHDEQSNPVVKRRLLHQYVDQCVQATIAAHRPSTPPKKSQLIVLSGGSASNVGALVKALERTGTINPKAMLRLDSEAIIDSGAVPAFTESAGDGNKHPEKRDEQTKRLFQYLIIDAAEYYIEQLKKHGIAGTIVVDDHCENVNVPMALAFNAKALLDADVGYVCVARDPRLGLESAKTRADSGGGSIATKLQLDTYRFQPKNWDTLSRCKRGFDATTLVHMSRSNGTVPDIIARRIGEGPVDILNAEELFYFNCTRDMPNGADSAKKVFPKDPHELYREQMGGVIRKRGQRPVAFEEMMSPPSLQPTDSFVARAKKDETFEKGGKQ